MLPFYEYSLYARSKRLLQVIAEMGVDALDFDPRISIIPSCVAGSAWERVAWVLRRAVGWRKDHDWHMFITGPSAASVSTQFVRMAESIGGYSDGGGYDFQYDPYEVYSTDDVEKYTLLAEKECREAEERLRMSMSPEERERYDAAVRAMDELDDTEAMRTFQWGEDGND